MRPRIAGAWTALLALLTLAGCGGNNTYNPSLSGGGVQGVSISVDPPTATVPVGGTQAFNATVTGDSNASVTWSVRQDGAGGSITAGGIYTAPNTPGTDTVVATSQADTTKTATATVTVQSGSLEGTIR